MPIRIYALAKDLKIDSKELVEFCNKAGIPGKGSALASLEDDEIVKLRGWMEASATKRAASGPAPLVDTKAVLSSPVAGTATLPPPPPPSRPSPLRTRIVPTVSAPAAPVFVAPPPSITVAPPAHVVEGPSTVSAKAPATEMPHSPAPPQPSAPAHQVSRPAALAPAAPTHAPPEPSPIRGDSPYGAKRSSGIKVLDTKTKRAATDGRKKDQDNGGGKPPERRSPGMRFAAMPEVKQPAPTTRRRKSGPKSRSSSFPPMS